MFDLHISPRSVGRILSILFGILFVAHVAVVAIRIELGYDHVYGLAPRFDFDRPIGVPVWFGAVLLLLASIVSVVGAAATKFDSTERRYWGVIAALLLLMSISRVTPFHVELTSWLIENKSAAIGTWTNIYVPMLGVMGVLLLPFLWRLPRSSALAVSIAGAMIFVAPVAFERVETRIAETVASAPVTELTRSQWREVRKDWPYVMAATLEEGVEICGFILYVVAAMGYLSRRGMEIRVEFRNPATFG
jgi:hypothetical protein